MTTQEILALLDTLVINGTSIKIIRIYIESINKIVKNDQVFESFSIQNAATPTGAEIKHIVYPELYNRMRFLSKFTRKETLESKSSILDLGTNAGLISNEIRFLLEPVLENICEENSLLKKKYKNIFHNHFTIKF